MDDFYECIDPNLIRNVQIKRVQSNNVDLGLEINFNPNLNLGLGNEKFQFNQFLNDSDSNSRVLQKSSHGHAQQNDFDLGLEINFDQDLELGLENEIFQFITDSDSNTRVVQDSTHGHDQQNDFDLNIADNYQLDFDNDVSVVQKNDPKSCGFNVPTLVSEKPVKDNVNLTIINNFNIINVAQKNETKLTDHNYNVQSSTLVKPKRGRPPIPRKANDLEKVGGKSNKIASRDCRDRKAEKEKQLDKEDLELQEENKKLKKQIESLEMTIKIVKEYIECKQKNCFNSQPLE
ncbi:unnamed protein product [Brachionus calyciflorus]|uniref:BZIP domain-containing protein n=1 Tax=Brachionus calyciflorus TaxID=104777 RepID=A0A814ATF5_9BILA|nr:unnamed protein product [Brachionus calyciflorus]